MEINSLLSLVTIFQQMLISFVEVSTQSHIFAWLIESTSITLIADKTSRTSVGFFTVALVSIEQYNLKCVHSSVTRQGSRMTGHIGCLVMLTGGPFKGRRHRL